MVKVTDGERWRFLMREGVTWYRSSEPEHDPRNYVKVYFNREYKGRGATLADAVTDAVRNEKMEKAK